MDKKTWSLLKAIHNSISVSEISHKTGIPKSTVSRRLKDILSKTKVKYIVSEKALGLSPVIVFIDKKIENIPCYTISYRVGITSSKNLYIIAAYVPIQYLSAYLSLIDHDPIFVFKGKDRVIWNPVLSEKYGVISFSNNNILTNFSILNKIDEKIYTFHETNLDIFDLLIISYKEKNAFIPLSEIYKKGLKDKIFISRQALSYHFKKHVSSIWLGNTVFLYRPLNKYPLRLFIFEVHDVKNLVFKLSLIPYIYVTYYSDDMVAFSAQLTTLEIFKLYSNVLVHHKAKPILCEVYLKPSLVRFAIKYHCLWSNGWKKPWTAHKVRVWRG
ncbi:MAG: hypothetical protein DRJ52_06800 [Thermoprotei archaeon]|nr:MAG: hypothetical protein DRJ52_06800 [Thermoprotei archaeon]RLE99688.1 MAG: hypothetical protein DRJ63_04610 [Thermoprotei archaeon]